MLDADPPSRDRIVVAVALAERFGAHLVGLYVTPAAEPPGRLDYFSSDLPLLGPLYRDIEEQNRAQARNRRARGHRGAGRQRSRRIAA